MFRILLIPVRIKVEANRPTILPWPPNRLTPPSTHTVTESIL